MAFTVVGVFDNATDAQNAVDELVSDGFSRSNIDLSAQTGSLSDGTTYADTSNSTVPDRHRNTSGTYAEEVVDDTKDVGSSIGNFFSSLFGGDDDDRRERYTRVGERSSIVTVHVTGNDEAERAADILDDNGAINVDEQDEQYGYSSTMTGTDATLGATGSSATMGYGAADLTTDRDLTTGTDQTIKVIQEDLQVGKREVETGGVRVRSRIIERPVEESVRLREERVHVTRTPVNRPATDADMTAFQEGQIELTEHAEVPVVSKTANVVEEISIGKEVNERVETVHETVRSTDVEVENLGTSTNTGTQRGI
ncbi:YsnF/AvaK domain-containing protein [Spirosoma montaniterrae]|uniref:DUF2382 domain-containing protein n=1 Tax=Spirosoma montaniterrae TaxID=1178516 RepID=A0A1P9WV95_9BACT|nr:YsnF/AvaK domain-containing protein [Spirosoma montaniterrae]AQG79291.1 hypothetical protein AWR27_08105 [Spirosoma montaniterrae]